MVLKSSLIVREEIPLTATENLFEALDLDKDTAYESFIIKMNQTYNNEIDMYGDIKKAGESNLKVSNLNKDRLLINLIGPRIWYSHPVRNNRR